MYQLSAPHHILLSRIHERPRSKTGRPKIAPSRILRNLRLFNKIKYKDVTEFDTHLLSTKQIANKIIKDARIQWDALGNSCRKVVSWLVGIKMRSQITVRDIPKRLTINGTERSRVQFWMVWYSHCLFRIIRQNAAQFNMASFLGSHFKSERQKYFYNLLAGKVFKFWHERRSLIQNWPI